MQQDWDKIIAAGITQFEEETGLAIDLQNRTIALDYQYEGHIDVVATISGYGTIPFESGKSKYGALYMRMHSSNALDAI